MLNSVTAEPFRDKQIVCVRITYTQFYGILTVTAHRNGNRHTVYMYKYKHIVTPLERRHCKYTTEHGTKPAGNTL